MSYVIGQGVRGRKVTPSETFSQTMRRIGPLLLATLLVVGTSLVLVAGTTFVAIVGFSMVSDSSSSAMAVAVLLGFAAAAVVLVLALALQTLFAFTTPVVVLERRSALRSIARSWRLVGPPNRSGFWRILGTRLLTSIATSIIGQVIALPVTVVVIALLSTMVGDELQNVYYVVVAVLQGLVAILTGILTTPLIAGVDSLLYIDARIRREALDVELMRTGQSHDHSWASVSR
jgi:hypothetical protein